MSENLDKKLDELTNLVKAWIDAQEADACMGCVYLGHEDWEMPCAKCSRACEELHDCIENAIQELCLDASIDDYDPPY